MNCPNCKAELIWGGDHSYEDYGNEEEEGIVSNYSCLQFLLPLHYHNLHNYGHLPILTQLCNLDNSYLFAFVFFYFMNYVIVPP